MSSSMKGMSFDELMRTPPVDDPDYIFEGVKIDFSIALEAQRRAAGVPNKTIAERLKTSAAYISKVFRGDVNFTIESMVKLAHAVNGRVHLHIAPAGQKIQWHVVKKPAAPIEIEAQSRPVVRSTVVMFATRRNNLIMPTAFIQNAANDSPSQALAG
jgi:transcriptional regulator with XRE-family HTH domain